MDEFDPYHPAVLHDLRTDEIVTWIGELADDYVKRAKVQSHGIVEYDGRLFDGWGNVLGG